LLWSFVPINKSSKKKILKVTCTCKSTQTQFVANYDVAYDDYFFLNIVHFPVRLGWINRS